MDDFLLSNELVVELKDVDEVSSRGNSPPKDYNGSEVTMMQTMLSKR